MPCPTPCTARWFPNSRSSQSGRWRRERGEHFNVALLLLNINLVPSQQRMGNAQEIGMSNLLRFAVIFLVVALIAAFFGFGGVAGTAIEGARLLFWAALVLFAVLLVAGLIRRA